MFKDVKKTDWFYDALKRIHKLKRIAGFPDGTFQPNKALTRAEYVAGEDMVALSQAMAVWEI